MLPIYLFPSSMKDQGAVTSLLKVTLIQPDIRDSWK